MKWVVVSAVIYVVVFLGLLVAKAEARPPVPPTVFKAVRANFPTRALRVQAFKVAYCESKFHTGTISETGDYGLFQLNKQAHDGWLDFGPRIFDPFYNAHAAYRMVVNAKGWGPWYPSRRCWE